MKTKLRKNVALIVFGLVIGLGSNAHAVPLSATVDPGFAPGYSFVNSTTGTALFAFTHIDGPGDFVATNIFLTLESDVFDIANTTINAPAGWMVNSPLQGDGFDVLTATGGGLPEGDVFKFTMDYTLLDNAKALGRAGAWNEGGPWQIGYGAVYSPFHVSGGSTIMNPEPGTILLMGSGLLGLGLWRWKQYRK